MTLRSGVKGVDEMREMGTKIVKNVDQKTWVVLGDVREYPSFVRYIYDNFSYHNSQVIFKGVWRRFSKSLNSLARYKQELFVITSGFRLNPSLYSPPLNNSRKLFLNYFQEAL